MKQIFGIARTCLTAMTAFAVCCGGGWPQGFAEVAHGKPPSTPWLGAHLIIKNEADLDSLRTAIPDMAKQGLNVVVVEIDYNYQFKSRPEMFDATGVTFAGARQFAATCKQYGVRAIPEIDCLGHQSWAGETGALLTVHPELDETPGQYPGNKGIYCRSWCPLNPELPKIINPMIDELIDAFQATAFHCGMDEVFIIGSDYCPRCRGKNPAVLFATQVKSLYAHLHRKKIQMLMWGDRLLNAPATGYSEWDASQNGTEAAINSIPKDIVLCDWHYDAMASYPSLDIFLKAGFQVWPCTWRNVKAATAFSSQAKSLKDPKVLGVLSSTWGSTTPSQMATWPPFLAALAPWL